MSAKEEMEASLAAMERILEGMPPEAREEMRAMMQHTMSDPTVFFKDLGMMRQMEGMDAERYLSHIRQAFGEDFSGSGFAIDLGSQYGFIPGEYQLAFPSLTVIPTDLPAAEGEVIPIGLKMMEDCLPRLAMDHEEKGESERQQLYEKLWERARAVDVLDSQWIEVAEFENKCALVTSTNILQMKAMETPFMWRHILLGAARLLQPGGILVVSDQAPDGFSNRTVVERFASLVGLHVEVHEGDRPGLQKVAGAGEYSMILRRSEQVSLSFSREPGAFPVLAQHHIVQVHGIKGKPELNGLTAVLGQQLANGRWECQMAVPLRPGIRKACEAALKAENLLQLMPRLVVAVAEAPATKAH